ncbi:MAG: pilus assembly protein TadG-related protein [Gammaproteobacteria bacterium]
MSRSKHSSPVRDRLSGFMRSQRGSISVLTVAAVVPFVVAAGAAIDMGRANYTMGQMQKTVDSAALAAAATQTTVKGDGGEPLTGDPARIYVAEQMVETNLLEKIADTAEAPEVTITGDIVEVRLAAEMPTSFMGLVGMETMSLGVVAAADFSRRGRGCIVALGAEGDGIEVGGTVTLEVDDCWLHSNRKASKSIDVIGKATIHAGGSCSVGSTSVSNNATVYRHRYSGCRQMDDPMADWQPPEEPAGCEEPSFDKKGSGGTIVLTAGTYCGGLQLSGYDNVEFGPGTYHISGGPLTINSKANVSGENVGFHLASDVTSMTINGAADVTLSAQDSGPMANKLVAMEPLASGIQPDKKDLISAKINGGSELDLTGMVYLPTATLDISGNSTNSYMATQVLAYSIKLSGTSHLSFKEQLDEFGNPVGPEFVTLVRLIK